MSGSLIKSQSSDPVECVCWSVDPSVKVRSLIPAGRPIVAAAKSALEPRAYITYSCWSVTDTHLGLIKNNDESPRRTLLHCPFREIQCQRRVTHLAFTMSYDENHGDSEEDDSDSDSGQRGSFATRFNRFLSGGLLAFQSVSFNSCQNICVCVVQEEITQWKIK